MPRQTIAQCMKCGLRPRCHTYTLCNICRQPQRRAASMKAWRTRKMMAKARGQMLSHGNVGAQ